MKTQIICRESYFVFQKHTEICPKTNWTIFNLKKGDDLSVYCYRHTTWLGYKGRVKKHFCICVRIQLLFSHSKGTMNICVNSSTPTSQCNAICCNNLQHPFCCHTYRELRPEMSWQRRAEKNKTKINKLKRFIFYLERLWVIHGEKCHNCTRGNSTPDENALAHVDSSTSLQTEYYADSVWLW